MLRDAARELVHALLGDLDAGPRGRGGRRATGSPRPTVRRPASSRWSTRPRPRRSSPTGGSSSAATLEVFTRPTRWRRWSPTWPTRCRRRRSCSCGRAARVPKSLTDAVQGRRRRQVDTSPGRKVAGPGSTSRSATSGLRLDRAATDRLVAMARRGPAAAGRAARPRWSAAFGAGARLGADDVEPYLGEAGGVPPWELTDAIDRGDIPGALAKLHRMLGRRRAPRPAGHGDPARTTTAACWPSTAPRSRGEKDAAALLGLKGSTFPARKALQPGPPAGPRPGRARRSGCWRRPTSTCAARKAWPDELVLEVLVARLARWPLTSRPGPRRRALAAGRRGQAGVEVRSGRSRLGVGQLSLARALRAATCGGRPGSCGSRPWRRPCRCA